MEKSKWIPEPKISQLWYQSSLVNVLSKQTPLAEIISWCRQHQINNLPFKPFTRTWYAAPRTSKIWALKHSCLLSSTQYPQTNCTYYLSEGLRARHRRSVHVELVGVLEFLLCVVGSMCVVSCLLCDRWFSGLLLDDRRNSNTKISRTFILVSMRR